MNNRTAPQRPVFFVLCTPMQPDSQAIKGRFFQALDEIIKRRQLRGKKSFATRYELNWGNFYQLRVNPSLQIEPAYLAWMVRDFNVSARWLLTGEGEMFVQKRL